MTVTNGAIDALKADRAALLEICANLSDGEWNRESGCGGWSVQDVVAHLDALFWVVVDPSRLPDTTGLSTERAQEVYVEARRSWSADRVLSDYESVSDDAIGRLAGLEDQDFELPLGDLGTYPASMVPNAFSFDHYTHLRADLFSPRGPLTGEAPPSDELRLVPALDWIEAALPQQNPGALAALAGSLEVIVDGPGARTIRVGPGAAAAQIRCDSAAFVRFITQRATLEEAARDATGDAEHLAIARTLKVF
jgi:uncharacterized protein (TIGR03083 family)